ncbi:MAG: ABC transporter substrate-binding protein [Robiginitomaculum sp.]|nr:MAG: ABC transporter substrate-binding protein [Robiginitomaculum sp.]
MKRRHLLVGAAALATGATTAAVLGGKPENKNRQITRTEGTTNPGPNISPNIGKNRRQFRLVTSWPKDFPGLGIMANRLADFVGTMTEGRIEIKVYAAGELVGATEVFDAVSTGAADMYHSAEYYWQGKAKGFSFFTAVPMGMTATEIVGWVNFGGGRALWDDLSAKFNIKAFHAGNTGHQMGGWFKKEINSLEDFKGLKMRMPGIGGEVIRRLGGAAVRLSGGEIYQALQSGAIDATEWVGPWNDYAFGFYREAPYYYGPGFHEPGAALSLGVNLDVWNSLSSSDQAIFKAACHAANDLSVGEYTHENAKALKILKDNHNISPRVFSEQIWDKIGRISEEVVAEIGNSDKQTRAIYDSYIKARNSYRTWTEISDGAYIRARAAALR